VELIGYFVIRAVFMRAQDKKAHGLLARNRSDNPYPDILVALAIGSELSDPLSPRHGATKELTHGCVAHQTQKERQVPECDGAKRYPFGLQIFRNVHGVTCVHLNRRGRRR
jgi:hypothetical protein